MVISAQEIEIYFQPIFTPAGIFGWESLGRRVNDKKIVESIYPYLKAAEQNGTLEQLDMLLLREALIASAKFPKGTKLFLNVATKAGLRSLFTPDVEWFLRRYGWENICLEISEDIRASLEELRPLLLSWRKNGGKIALDDFGRGRFSLDSFNYLKPHFVKYDKWLLKDLLGNTIHINFLNSLTKWIQWHGALVIVEGVELKPYIEELYALGCDGLQGYGLAHPMPLSHALDFMRETVREEAAAYYSGGTTNDALKDAPHLPMYDQKIQSLSWMAKKLQQKTGADWTGVWVFDPLNNLFSLAGESETSGEAYHRLPISDENSLYTKPNVVHQGHTADNPRTLLLEKVNAKTLCEIPLVEEHLLGLVTLAFRDELREEIALPAILQQSADAREIITLFLKNFKQNILDAHLWQGGWLAKQDSQPLMEFMASLLQSDELTTILQQVSQYAQQVSHSVVAGIALHDGERFVVQAMHSEDREVADSFKQKADQLRSIYSDKHPLQVTWEDAFQHNLHQVADDILFLKNFTPWRHFLIEQGIRSMSVVPICKGENRYGVLVAYADIPGYYTQEVLSQLQGVSHLAASMIHESERRRLEKKHREAMEAYCALNHLLAHDHSEEDIMESIADFTMSLLECDLVFIRQTDEKLQTVVNKAIRLRYHQITENMRKITTSIDEEIIVELSRGEPIHFDARHMDRIPVQYHETVFYTGFPSFFAIGLVDSGKYYGTIVVGYRHRQKKLREFHSQTLKILARYTTSTIVLSTYQQKLKERIAAN